MPRFEERHKEPMVTMWITGGGHRKPQLAINRTTNRQKNAIE